MFFCNQVKIILDDAEDLRRKYSDAGVHISKKQNALGSLLNKFQEEHERIKIHLQKELSFIEIQKEYQALMEWVAEKIAIMTANDLADSYNDGVYLLQKHDDMIKDINAKLPDIDQFSAKCRENIPNIPFQSDNLHKMISNIAHRKEFLIECWTSRKNLYKQHLDFLKWRSEINSIESWLNEKEGLLATDETGETIEEVEELLRRHAELEELLGFENDRVDRICRPTIIESQLKLLKEKEETNRLQEAQRKEKEAEEALKRRENLRATREKKRSEERRRTQEIVFTPR